MGKRDHGVTTSVLLANQRHEYERKLKEVRNSNFRLNDALGRCQKQRNVLERFLEEKGLLDQWQSESE